MKTIWSVETRVMNGTVTIQTLIDSFLTEESARKAAKVLYEKNKANINCVWDVITTVHESKLYESEDEMPILNENETV